MATRRDLEHLDRQIAGIMEELVDLLAEPTKDETGELLEGEDRKDLRKALAALRRIRHRADDFLAGKETA